MFRRILEGLRFLPRPEPRLEDALIVKDLDIDAVKAGLSEGAIVIVDVREPHEFAAGRIPGSLSMPLSQFNPVALPDKPGQRIVFSCAAGIRSMRALEFAQAAGIDVDSHYLGGFKDWVMRGEPIER